MTFSLSIFIAKPDMLPTGSAAIGWECSRAEVVELSRLLRAATNDKDTYGVAVRISGGKIQVLGLK